MGQKQGKAKRPSTPGAAKGPSEAPVERRPSAQPKPSRRPSEAVKTATEDAPTLVRKTSSQQADELNVYAKPRTHGGSMSGRKTSSASDMSAHRRGSFQDASKTPTGKTAKEAIAAEVIAEDVPQQRKMLFDHLVAFYFRNDHERLLNGDVDLDGICDWALSGGPDGIASLNERLRNKYGEDLDTFLINAAAGDDDDEGDGEENEEDTASEENDTVPAVSEPRKSGTEVPAAPHEATELGHNAALERPAIPTARRRPTNTMRFTLDENGQLVAPESAQLDHAPAQSLESQLKDFIMEVDASRAGEIDKFVKFANDHGLIALNSELLVTFGKDLKGNTLNGDAPEGATGENTVRKFGVGLDNKMLSEMQNHKLHHEDSGRIELQADPETGACNKFRLDTESPVFGMCKCGHERGAHMKRSSVVASGTLERKLAQRRASINVDAMKQQQQQAPPPIVPAPAPVAAAPAAVAAPPALVAMAPAPAAMTEVALPQPETIAASKPKPPSSSKPPASGTGPKPPRPKSVRRRPASGKKTLERLEGGEKKSEACALETFQLDMSASEFGTCAKCGWKKSEHKPGGSSSEPAPNDSGNPSPTVAIPKRPMSLRKDGPPEPCSNYKLDLTADTFGACVCGFARQAHKGHSSNTKVVSTTLEKRWAHVKDIA